MMLHRHFETETEKDMPEKEHVAEPANKSGTIAEGADIMAGPAQTKPKRTTRKKAAETK